MASMFGKSVSNLSTSQSLGIRSRICLADLYTYQDSGHRGPRPRSPSPSPPPSPGADFSSPRLFPTGIPAA